jgi:hypothetical protein
MHPYPAAYEALSNNNSPPTWRANGTLLHKGFYDLLAMIPTPSPSRLLWGAPSNHQPEVEPLAGPRYEDIKPNTGPVSGLSSSPAYAKKGRRISKDMVSKPTGFVYVQQIYCLSEPLSHD